MKVTKLNEIQEFPAYVEHFGNFYIVQSQVINDCYLQSVTGKSPMPVTPERSMNTYTEAEYLEVLQAKAEQGNKAAELEKVDPSQNFAAIPEEGLAAQTASQAQIKAQLEAATTVTMNDKGEGVAGDEPKVPESEKTETSGVESLAQKLTSHKK